MRSRSIWATPLALVGDLDPGQAGGLGDQHPDRGAGSTSSSRATEALRSAFSASSSLERLTAASPESASPTTGIADELRSARLLP
jgi:hypothetical protein